MDPNPSSRDIPPEARPDRATRAAAAASGGAHAYSADDPPPADAPADALREAAARFAEVKEYASYYVGAKLDAWKGTARNLVVYVVLGIIGMAVGSAMLATASVLLLVGIAHGLGDLLWDKWWLGDLIVGLLFIGGLAAGVIFGMRWLTHSARKQLVGKYEDRQRQQRVNYGHDVHERAANGGGRG